jgi:prepilin-type processing-associated H-X9-DG protein
MWGNPDTATGTQVWRVTILPYVKMGGKVPQTTDDLYDPTIPTVPLFSCPDTANLAKTSYGYNLNEMTKGWDGATGTFAGHSESGIHAPASLVMFSDAAAVSDSAPRDPFFTDGDNLCDRNNPVDPNGCGYPNGYRYNPEVWKPNNGPDSGTWGSCDSNMSTPGTAGDWEANGARRPIFPHQGRTNAVFADGHAKSLSAGSFKVRFGAPDDVWHNMPK